MVRKTLFLRVISSLIVLISFLSLLVISSNFVSAIDSFHNAWHYPGESFTVNDVLYSVSEGSDCHQINFGRESEYYILNVDDCVETRDGFEKICFLETACPNDDDHIHYEAGRIIYGAKIALYDLVPKLAIKQSASTTKLKIGEITTISNTITNPGEKTVSDGVFSVNIPDGFSLYSKPPGASFTNGVLKQNFIIPPGTSKTISYKLKIDDYLSESLKPNITYSYNEIKLSKQASSLTINVPSPYLISQSLSKKSIGINEETVYSFSFQNNDGQADIPLKASLLGVNGLKVIWPPEFVNGVYETILSPDEKKSFSFTMSSKFSGDVKLSLKLDFDIAGKAVEKNYSNALSIALTPAKPTINIKNEYFEGEEFILRALLKNPSKLNSYYNVRGYVKNTKTGQIYNFHKERVPKNTDSILLEQKVFAPNVNSSSNSETITFLMSGTYESISGEKFEFDSSKNVKIDNKKEPFLVTRTINNSDISAGDNLEVVVKVKNQIGEYAPLVINDILPDSVFVKAGFRSIETSIADGDEKQVYIYKINLPETYVDNKLKIVTKIYNKNTGEVYEKETDYGVKPRVLTQKEIVDEVKNNSKKDKDIVHTKEKKGFFEKIIDGISNFFDKIFN